MKKQLTIEQLLLTDDLSKLAGDMFEDFEPETLVLIGQDKNDKIRIRHSCRSRAELVGSLEIALNVTTNYHLTE